MLWSLFRLTRWPALCNFEDDKENIVERTSCSYYGPRMKNKWARGVKPRVAPVGHNHRRKSRGHEHVGSERVEVHSNALLCVNKKIHMEATPVLYSRTKFRFKSADTMRRFVDLIGHNIQYLRDVGIFAGGFEFRCAFRRVRHAIEALAAAKSMHTFEISHVDICPNVSTNFRKYYPGSHELVKLCKPLLESLRIAYETNDLKASIFEVIKIDDPNNREFEFGCDGDCGCEVEQAVIENVELDRGLKHLVAEQHGLELDS